MSLEWDSPAKASCKSWDRLQSSPDPSQASGSSLQESPDKVSVPFCFDEELAADLASRLVFDPMTGIDTNQAGSVSRP